MFKPRKEIQREKKIKGIVGTDEILNKLKNVNLNDISFGEDEEDYDILNQIVDKQLVFTWSRLLINEEIEDLQIGDEIIMSYKYSDLTLELKFGAFAKVTEVSSTEEGVTEYITEDDKRVLCLMVNEEYLKDAKYSTISRLFKRSKFFEYLTIQKGDLVFKNKRTNEPIDFYSFSY